MLPSNFIKFLAPLGVAFLLSVLASSSTSRAEKNEAATTTTTTNNNSSKLSLIPPIDKDFKNLLSTIIDDEELANSLAQYMEITPISHRSRSSMMDVIEALLPALIQNNSTESDDQKSSNNESQETTTTTGVKIDNSSHKSNKLAKYNKSNPMKKVVGLIIQMASCEANTTCSDLICSILEKTKKNKNNKIHSRIAAPEHRSPNSRQHNGHYHGPCETCPVPDFCPLPDGCNGCPPKPVCPCGEEAEVTFHDNLLPTRRPRTNSTRSMFQESHNHHALHHNRQNSNNKTPKPPCWLPGQKNCTPTSTTTTTGKPGASTSKKPIRSSTKRMRTSTTKKMSSSSTMKPISSSSTTERMSSTSTTEKMASSTTTKKMRTSSTTKKMKTSTTTEKMSSSTTKPNSSSTTTRRMSTSTTGRTSTSTTGRTSTSTTGRTSTSTTERMSTSTSTSTTTTKQPTSSSTTEKSSESSSKKPGSSTTTTKKSSKMTTTTTKKSGPKVINEKEEQSSEKKKTITVDGKKTETTLRNTTVSNLEFLQLEDGLKYLLRNKTVVSYITDSINSMPFRSGGIEGRLAGRVLHHFGEDTSRWKVKSRGADRSMTYSTLKRNLIIILRNLVGSIIRKNCKHCVESCENKLPQLPEDDIVDGTTGCESASTTATTTTTIAPTSTTTTPPSQDTGIVASRTPSLRVCAPCEFRETRCPAPQGCTMYRCNHTTYGCEYLKSRTTAKPSQVDPNTTTSDDNNNSKLDPDFAPDDLAAPRVGDGLIEADLNASSSSSSDLDDMDIDHQISESDRFMEIPCNGSICLDQKQICGSADLNELTRKKSTPYIVNGETQKYGEWPSYAKIIIHLNELDKSQCGGVLIGKKHILTAGHCVREPPKRDDDDDDYDEDGTTKKKEKKDKLLTPDQLEIVLGEHDRDKKDKYEISHKVSKICSSSKFNNHKDEGSRFDFAILTLKNEVKYNDHIQPACLPYKPFPIGKQKCFAVGQGKMRELDEDYLVTPKFVQKMPVGRRTCRPWGFNDYDRSRWCFTKVQGPGDTCNGDSGGPILCKGKDMKWYVMGLVSYGSENCDGAESPGWVAVYTRIPALVGQMHIDCLNKA